MQALKRVVSAVFVGTLLLAAPTMRADEKTDHGHGHGAGHWDKFDMLKKKLDLTDDQVSQWRDAEKGQHERTKLLMDKAKADKAELAVLVDEKASEGELKAGLKALMDDHKSMQERTEKQMETLRKLLTPLQQAKLVLMMGGHHGRQGGFGGGWGRHGQEGGWQGGPHDGMGGGMHGPDQSEVPDNGMDQADASDNGMGQSDFSDNR